MVSDKHRRLRSRQGHADWSGVRVSRWVRTSSSAEDAADAVLDDASENLATNASHAHAPARRGKVACPFLLGIAVATESGAPSIS